MSQCSQCNAVVSHEAFIADQDFMILLFVPEHSFESFAWNLVGRRYVDRRNVFC
jgi:hypothetical protein